jgi:hypothetical protein
MGNLNNLSLRSSPAVYPLAAFIGLVISALCVPPCAGAVQTISPESAQQNEAFEHIANALQPGDELILLGGTYSQTGRRALTVKGTREKPILIRAASGERPLLTRPQEQLDQHNNLELVDCQHVIIRGLSFQGGSCGVRFIRGHHVTMEDCEILETGNNALTMNSGDCHAMVIRRNHIHHTGLSTQGPTEGEGMYIGCHDGSCKTTDSVFEGNYIHHLRSTSGGGNDGIEIKVGSHGNIVRDNVIHDTNIGRQYPGIFVYGGGPGTNVVEGNVIWNAGEGIQVVSDAIIRNNIIFDCIHTGITASPHAALPQVRNVSIQHNTIYNIPTGVRLRWAQAANAIFSNNAIYCPESTAMRIQAGTSVLVRNNAIRGERSGDRLDGPAVWDGGDPAAAFESPAEADFWPKPNSPLRGKAGPISKVAWDFNGNPRTEPLDVGAYESEGHSGNPGWKVQGGFKRPLKPR